MQAVVKKAEGAPELILFIDEIHTSSLPTSKVPELEAVSGSRELSVS